MNRRLQRFHRQMVQMAIGLLFLTLVPIAQTNSSGPANPVPEASSGSPYAMAWSAPAGDGWEIFLSRFTADGWGPATQLTSNGNRNLVPCVISEDNDTLWVFWSSQQNDQFLIYSARIGSEEREVELIDTSMINNMAPTAIVDREGVIWLVWSSFDGTDDDIFFTRRENGRWSPPLRVNFDDYTPDIQPLLGMNADGTIWVLWRGFEEDHYRFFASLWNGREWESEVSVEDDSRYFEQIRTQLNDMPDLPSKTIQPDKGSVHFKEAAIQSLPLFIQTQLPRVPAQ